MRTKRRAAVRASWPARWRALGPRSQPVLAVLLLHPAELSDAWLAELAPEPQAIDALVTGGWIQEVSPGRWTLDPSVDRAVLRTLVPWSRRRAAHLALAGLLRRERSQWAAAAQHLASAGQRDEAGRLWLAAAREHCRRHHHRHAQECFVQAVRHFPAELDDRELVEAVRDFGTCAGLQRATDQALEVMREWREVPGLARRATFQAEAARVEAALLARAQRHVDSAHAHRTAAHHFDQANDPAGAASELAAAATTLAYALHVGAAEEAAEQAMVRARAAGRVDLEAQAAVVRGFCLGMRGETAGGRRQVEAALDLALGAGLTAQAADAYRILGNVREYASCYHDVPEAFARALTYCRRHGEADVAGLCVGCLSYSLFRSGNWRRSVGLARQVLAEKHAPPASRCVAHWVLGLVQACRGEFKPAAGNLGRALAAARELGLASMELLGLAGAALQQELTGARAEAAGTYRRLLERWGSTEDRHDVVPGFTAAVVFFAAQGDRPAASEFAAALERIASTNPNPEMIGAAALAAGELQLLDGKPAPAADSFAAAIRWYEQRGLTVEILRGQLRCAHALQQAGNGARAEPLLREARAHAVRLGARPFAAQAAALLAAGAAPPVRAAPAPWAALSPRQREVAQLLAAGRTNKEIAQALGLSVRTVDMHVAHLLARLDCRTRSAAAARLAGLR